MHAQTAIPNEMGPTHCRATWAFTSQPTRARPRPPDACRQFVLAVCPLLNLVSGWSGRSYSQGAPTAPSTTPLPQYQGGVWSTVVRSGGRCDVDLGLLRASSKSSCSYRTPCRRPRSKIWVRVRQGLHPRLSCGPSRVIRFGSCPYSQSRRERDWGSGAQRMPGTICPGGEPFSSDGHSE